MFVVGLVDPVTSRIPTNPRPWDEVFILDPRGLFSGPSFSAPAFSSTAGPLWSAWARGNRKKGCQQDQQDYQDIQDCIISHLLKITGKFPVESERCILGLPMLLFWGHLFWAKASPKLSRILEKSRDHTWLLDPILRPWPSDLRPDVHSLDPLPCVLRPRHCYLPAHEARKKEGCGLICNGIKRDGWL